MYMTSRDWQHMRRASWLDWIKVRTRKKAFPRITMDGLSNRWRPLVARSRSWTSLRIWGLLESSTTNIVTKPCWILGMLLAKAVLTALKPAFSITCWKTVGELIVKRLSAEIAVTFWASMVQWVKKFQRSCAKDNDKNMICKPRFY